MRIYPIVPTSDQSCARITAGIGGHNTYLDGIGRGIGGHNTYLDGIGRLLGRDLVPRNPRLAPENPAKKEWR